jgi:pyrimidine-nucleoside phosphorylase
MSIHTLLQTRRDGRTHSREEIEELVRGAVDGTIKDYQLSAWLMAAYLNPLSPEETALLTVAMANSGETLDLSSLPKPRLDKHSTGGVGDKTSIALLPILASCGVTIVKMSGRGLGITGGTIDKLSAIPGFRLDFSPDQLIEQAGRIGIALSGQTPLLAPADKVLYALRDATETVESIPLIVSSILSKKMAVGADTIVLDVKCGSGAFMKDIDDARRLAQELRRIASLVGLRSRIALSDMSVPLGKKVGNSLELQEAFDTLCGADTGRFRQLCIRLSGMALEACELVCSRSEGEKMALDAIESGKARQKAEQWIEAQGGNPAVVRNFALLPRSKYEKTIRSPHSGWIQSIDAQTIGEVAIDLGAGRKVKEDLLDLGAGLVFAVEPGDRIRQGEPLVTLYADSESKIAGVEERLIEAIRFSETPITPNPLLIDVI